MSQSRKFQPVSPSPLAAHAQPLPLPAPPVPAPEIEPDKSIPSTLLNRLKTFPLFKDAPQSFHAKVGAKLKLVQYHAQEYIIKEGDPALSMFWILKGTVSVASTDGDSVYAELSPGSFFGEIGILFNRPRTATVMACQKVLVGVLTADALNVVLRSYPVIERRIRDEAQERLAMQEKKNKADIPIVKLSTSPAPTGDLLKFLPSIVPPLQVPSPLLQLVSHSHSSSRRPSASVADNVDQTVSIQDFIKSVPIFKNVPRHIIHKLALGVEPISLKPFEYVFRKGTKGSDIYFIIHGEVEVLDVQDNVEVKLARLRSGSYFGEMSFLDFIQGGTNITRSASICLVTSVELLVIRTDLLEAVCHQYPYVVDEMRIVANERKSSNTCSQKPLSACIHDLCNPPTTISTASLHSASTSSSTTPSKETPPFLLFFTPNWDFDGSQINRKVASRSVSPVSQVEDEAQLLKSRRDELWKRKLPDPHPLPSGPLNMTIPALNPTPFKSFQMRSRENSFHYMPHNKRIKLSTLAGRRRSSVLVSTGSIPDKVLLGAFEFLDLPTLMRLRLVSRRWRQLLYAAPNLFKKLDLTHWNTSVNDKALINITDFVGLRPKYIDISNCFHVTDEGFSYLVNEIGMAGQISVFKMRCLWEVSAMAIMDLTSPSVGRYLEEVCLSNCRKVKDNVVERLIGWPNDADGVSTYLPGSEGIYNNEAGSQRLRVLDLGYCKHLTDNIMYHISLHANERLESLDLTRCLTITDAGFQHWTYRSFPNLKKLSLKDCTYLSDKAIISLANAAPNLEILNLNFCCALLDIAIEVLCLGCQKLRELDLSFCGSAVSDSSLVAISLHLCHLEKLIVKGCVRVTRAGVDALLSGYSPLHYIDIRQCRNAHVYPGRVPAQKFEVSPGNRSAFISAGPAQKIIEMVI